MTVAVITGSTGLVGSACVEACARRGLDIIGVDNDARRAFFGEEASTVPQRRRLCRGFPRYTHQDADIRNFDFLSTLLSGLGRDVALLIHAAAQPSHDWSARHPHTDFSINALGTLNLLEAARRNCPETPFVSISTSKVYGDTPNTLPLMEAESRFDLPRSHRYWHGIDESMPVDQSLHSLFGVSKLAGDLLVQEYGRNFGLQTAVFRPGCVTGAAHAGAELHGFLAYLVACAARGAPYTIYGYGGKQVRDNIHARDLAEAVLAYALAPSHPGAVYNIGAGRRASCSVLEAIEQTEALLGRSLNTRYSGRARTGDHLWWVSDSRKFTADYPGWAPAFDLKQIFEELVDAHR